MRNGISVSAASTIALGVLAGSGRGASVFNGAAAAYSVRVPAGSTYSGPLIRVRRSSDNAESVFYATWSTDGNGNRWLDTTALLAFTGANSGFVTTWYDQSGNGRNATQSTAGAQPRIVNAGVVDVINTKPAVFFSGSTWLLTPRFVISGGHVISAVSSVSDNNTRRLFSQGNTGGQLTPTGVTLRSVGASGWNWSNNSGGAATGGSNSGLQINTATNQNGALTLRRNGTQVASGSGGGGGNITAPYTSNISGYENGAGELYFGYAPEILLFSSFLGSTASVLNLERNQGTAFGITVA